MLAEDVENAMVSGLLGSMALGKFYLFFVGQNPYQNFIAKTFYFVCSASILKILGFPQL